MLHALLPAGLALGLVFARGPARAADPPPGPLAAYGELTYSLPGAGAPSSSSSSRWWTSLGDPALAGIVEEGLAHNLSLAGSRAAVDQTEATARQTRAGLLPSLSADLSTTTSSTESLKFQYSTLTGSTGGGGAGSDLPDTYTSGTLALNGSLAVDLFGRSYLGWRASRHDTRASEGDLDAVALSLVTRLTGAWLDRVSAAAQLAIVQEQVEADTHLLELVRMRYEGSEANALDVLQQEQQLAAARTQVPEARAILRTLTQQLAVLLGHPPLHPLPDPPATLPDLPPLPPLGDPLDLVQRRPDLRALQARYEAARDRRRSAARAFLPTVSLSGQAGRQGRYMEEYSDVDIWSVSASVSLPLFSGGQNLAELQALQAAESAAALSLEEAFLQAVQQVESALVNVEETRAGFEAHQARLTAARRSFRESENRYREGLASYLDVLTALDALHQARLSHVQAHRQALDASIQLRDALGGTWTRDLPRPRGGP